MRVLAAVLLLANLVFFGWTRGWLDDIVGVRAIGDREPERLARQVRPEAVRVITPQAVLAAASAAESRLRCLEAGPLTQESSAALMAELSRSLPSVAIVNQKTERPGTFLVYLGPFATPELALRKREELGRTRLPYDDITQPPALSGGFSLGRFETRAAAEAALAQVTRRNVRTARVVEQAAPLVLYSLRADRVDQAGAAKLLAFKPAALAAGITFTDCASR